MEMKMSRESHKKERDVLTMQIKELQQELQSVKVSVCCLHLALQYYWYLLIHKEKSNEMQQCIKILLFHIYMKLNMFRATHHPSSGA
jgi:plastocyanin domain-containing protein